MKLTVLLTTLNVAVIVFYIVWFLVSGKMRRGMSINLFSRLAERREAADKLDPPFFVFVFLVGLIQIFGMWRSIKIGRRIYAASKLRRGKHRPEETQGSVPRV